MSRPYSHRRVLRRELHSPRSVLAIAVSVAVIVLCVFVGAEIILDMLNQRALLAAPEDMLATLEVNDLVNDVRKDGPELIEPREEQAALF